MKAAFCILLAITILTCGTIMATPMAQMAQVAQNAGVQTPAAPGDKIAFTDENVEKAVRQGIAHLLKLQQADGSWGANGNYKDGPTAIALYAIMEAGGSLESSAEPMKGCSPQDANIKKGLEWLKNNRTDYTYCLGLRCLTWLTANRKTNDAYQAELEKDARQLEASTADGSYNYESKGDAKSSGDHSNSQYGLLGVWAGLMGKVEIDDKYWAKVMNHWNNAQCADGSWAYGGRANSGTGTMSAAGLATVFVCFDQIFANAFVECKGQTDYPSIKRGLDWFSKNFADMMTKGGNRGDLLYFLYGVERVGLAAGYKYFGTADWYKMGATAVLNSQNVQNGGWGGLWGDVPSTSWALLFLIRGRQPVIFNKLEHGGDWNNRPRALASFVNRVGIDYETPLSWQIINLQAPVSEWHDAPILLISGSKAVTFTPQEMDKLRTYVYQGGVILSVAECGGTGFTKSMKDVYSKLFPDYELALLGPEHEIYSIYNKLSSRGKLSGVSNGVRMFAFHSEDDILKSWQVRSFKTEKWAYDLGANIYFYVTDKKSLLRPRGTSPWPEEKNYTTNTSITLARLKTSGNFDPEPLAYKRFSLLMARLAKVDVNVVGPIPIAELAKSNAKIAVITGTDRFSLSQADKAALQAFVNGGGTLFMDSAGGAKGFANAAQELIAELWGANSLNMLALSHPIYRPADKKFEIDTIRFRRKTSQSLGKSKEPQLRAVLVGDRPAVIFSREDVTAGLLGYACAAVDGYHPGDGKDAHREAGEEDTKLGSAFRIMRNVVLFAGGVKAAATSAPASGPSSTSAPSSTPATETPASTPAATTPASTPAGGGDAPASTPAPAATPAATPAAAPAAAPANAPKMILTPNWVPAKKTP